MNFVTHNIPAMVHLASQIEACHLTLSSKAPKPYYANEKLYAAKTLMIVNEYTKRIRLAAVQIVMYNLKSMFKSGAISLRQLDLYV